MYYMHGDILYIYSGFCNTIRQCEELDVSSTPSVGNVFQDCFELTKLRGTRADLVISIMLHGRSFCMSSHNPMWICIELNARLSLVSYPE